MQSPLLRNKEVRTEERTWVPWVWQCVGTRSAGGWEQTQGKREQMDALISAVCEREERGKASCGWGEGEAVGKKAEGREDLGDRITKPWFHLREKCNC